MNCKLVEAAGPQVTSFKVGDKVAAAKKFGAVGNQYGTYQRYVIAKDVMASKVPKGIGQLDRKFGCCRRSV